MKVSPIQSNFNGGEFSPLLYGRVDTERYATGLAICKNYIPTIQGGLTRRPGTYFVSEVKDSSKSVRLIPFEFSTVQAYMLEFGDQYIRFYKNHALLLGTPELITNGTFGTGITGWTVSAGVYWDAALSSLRAPSAGDTAQQTVVITSPADTHRLRYRVRAGSLRLQVGTTAGGGEIFDTMVADKFTGYYYLDFTPGVSPIYLTFTAGSAGVTLDDISLKNSASSVYEIATDYTESDLKDIRYTQSADVVYLTHPNHPPQKLSRTADTSWSLDELDLLDGPYLPTNDTTTTITPSGTSGTVTLTASTSIFAATDVGRAVRIRHLVRNWAVSTAYAVGDVVQNDGGKVYECITAGTSAGSGGPTGTGGAITDNTVVWAYRPVGVYHWGWALISVYTSGTVVSAVVQRNLGAIEASLDWRLGLYSDTTGYPNSSIFHEDRLFFAGSAAAPQRIDGSVIGDYESFEPTTSDGTTTDDLAVSFTFNSNTVNAIHWMSPDERGLVVGTSGGEWILRPSLQAEALTPTNVTAKQSTNYGGAKVQAVSAGKATIFVQRAGRKVRELRYFLQDEGFESTDITLLSEHITQSGVKEMARQTEPQPLLWVVRYDGVLACCTYERDLDALRVGWHRHILGGTSATGDALVENVAVIPEPGGTYEDVWVVVQRMVDGATVRHIEYITPIFDDTVTQEDAFFVDCGLTYRGPATDTISGLDHLEGETLAVLVDGATHPDVTVASGTITLDSPGAVVHVGYAYDSDGQILRLDAGAQDGTAIGKTRRIHRVGMMLHRTLGLEIGMNFDTLDMITFRTFDDPMDTAPALYSGIISETVEADYDFENQFCWRQRQPLPGTILAIMPQIVTQDRN